MESADVRRLYGITFMERLACTVIRPALNALRATCGALDDATEYNRMLSLPSVRDGGRHAEAIACYLVFGNWDMCRFCVGGF